MPDDEAGRKKLQHMYFNEFHVCITVACGIEKRNVLKKLLLCKAHFETFHVFQKPNRPHIKFCKKMV